MVTTRSHRTSLAQHHSCFPLFARPKRTASSESPLPLPVILCFLPLLLLCCVSAKCCRCWKTKVKAPIWCFRITKPARRIKSPKGPVFSSLIGKLNMESMELHPSGKAYERIYCECLLQDSFLAGDRTFGIPLHDIANPIYSKFMMHIPLNTKMNLKYSVGWGGLLGLLSFSFLDFRTRASTVLMRFLLQRHALEAHFHLHVMLCSVQMFTNILVQIWGLWLSLE